MDRKTAERRFIESGLFRLTEQDTPSLESDTLSDEQRLVYKALCSAAKKLAQRELVTLCAAFDGVSVDGNAIHGRKCKRCGESAVEPVTIGKHVYCLECTCHECGCELTTGEESVCNSCLEKGDEDGE